MFAFLLIVQSIVAASLVGVILMQRSEGGGLGVGGSSSGFMTARGAADFLTRSTSILGAAFIGLSILLAAVAGASREPATVDTSLAKTATPTSPPTTVPRPDQPLMQPPAGQMQTANQAAPAQNQAEPAVPLAQ
jgi:preprotein translocase subunit SecG